MEDLSLDSIPWERWFDKVYCLFYLPNRNRLARLETELERIDLLHSPVFQMRYMVPQKMEEIVHLCCKKVAGACNRLFEVGIGMENIRIMKEALLLGYERIMIIEDDAAFLKDKRHIIEILDAMPKGFGMCQMDKAIHTREESIYYNSLLANKRLNEYYVDASEKPFTLSTCNVYTREGMKKCVEAMEYRMGVIDCIAGHMDGEPAVAVENLAVQVIFGDCHNKDFYKKIAQLHSVYSLQNIDYKKYAVPQNYDYGEVVA